MPSQFLNPCSFILKLLTWRRIKFKNRFHITIIKKSESLNMKSQRHTLLLIHSTPHKQCRCSGAGNCLLSLGVQEQWDVTVMEHQPLQPIPAPSTTANSRTALLPVK